MVFFWAAEVTETKATVVQVPAGFVLNVSNAATSAFPADGAVSLGIETVQMDATPWKGAVAHLGKAAGACQVKLDLVFGAEQKVKFYLAKGQGKVHLTGYFQPGPPSDLFEEDIPVVVEHAEPAKKSKKRARDEPKATTVAWDQTPSSESESEDKAEKPKAEKAKAPTPAAKPKPTPASPAKKQENKPAAAANTAGQPGAGKRKKHKKHKKNQAAASQ